MHKRQKKYRIKGACKKGEWKGWEGKGRFCLGWVGKGRFGLENEQKEREGEGARMRKKKEARTRRKKSKFMKYN